MIINRQIIIYLVVLFISTIFGGCNEEVETDPSPGYIYLNMSFTRALYPDENLYNYNESRIRRVRVYIFEGENLETTLYTTFPDGTDGLANILGMPGVKIGFDPVKVKVGTKNVYAVINEPLNSNAQNLLNNVHSPTDLNSLEYELDQFVSFHQESRYCLPMFAEQTKIRVTHSDASSPINLKLQTKRALARVDIYVRKKDDVPYYIGLTPTSFLDIINSRPKGFYSPTVIPYNGLKNSYSAFLFSNQEIKYNYQLLCSFYTPERDCSTPSSKLGFKIGKIENKGFIKDYSATIGGNDDYINEVQNSILNQIERNCIYQVKCTFSKTAFYIESIESSIKDWEYGGELE